MVSYIQCKYIDLLLFIVVSLLTYIGCGPFGRYSDRWWHLVLGYNILLFTLQAEYKSIVKSRRTRYMSWDYSTELVSGISYLIL